MRRFSVAFLLMYRHVTCSSKNRQLLLHVLTLFGTQNTRKPSPGQRQSQASTQPSQQPTQQPVSHAPPNQPQQHQRPPSEGYPPQPMPYGFNPNQRFTGPGAHGFPPAPYPFPPQPYGAPSGWYPTPQGFMHMPPGQLPPQMPLGPQGQRSPMPPPQGQAGLPALGSTGAPEDQSQFPKADEKASSLKPAGSSGTPIPLQEAPSAVSPAAFPESKTETAVKPSAGPRSSRIVPAVPLQKKPAPSDGASGGKAFEDANRDARAAVAAAMAKLPTGQSQKLSAEDSVENLTKKVGEMRTHDGSRGGRGNYANNTGNHRGGRGGHRGGRGQHSQHGQKIEIPTTDYDFDAANAKFNKSELAKEAYGNGSPVSTTQDEPSIEPSAITSTPANGERRSSDALATLTSYNKSTSFFDDISSEIKDRQESHGSGQRLGGREFRHEERQKNMETFGQGSVDNNYRYRGRGRGRGRGSYSRGGPRGGARGGPGRGRGAAHVDA